MLIGPKFLKMLWREAFKMCMKLKKKKMMLKSKNLKVWRQIDSMKTQKKNKKKR